MVTRNPGIADGKPIIKGTRITVEMLADEYAAGRTVEQMLRSYPHLTREQIKAALDYDSQIIKDPKTV